MITQQELHQILNYDPESGIFTWKIKIKGSKNISPGTIAGYKQNMGYWSIMIKGKNYLAHRLAWLYVHGCMPKEEIDHHIPNDPVLGQFNNRINNLRLATSRQQKANRKLQSNNTSGYKGVSWIQRENKYRAQCGNIHVGYFSCPVEAAKAYDAKAKELYGQYAKLNFP
jgi:hypothetical protein